MAKKKDVPEASKPEETKQPEPETEEKSWVAKLSIKALGCEPRLPRGEKTQVLCRIYGKAQGLKHGEDKNRGDVWTALQGKFEGVNLQAGNEEYGKTLRSGKLFLPGGIQDVIEGAVREIENSANAETASVIFGLELSSVSANNPIGYTYQAKNLVQRATRDDLDDLRNNLPKLEAPKGA